MNRFSLLTKTPSKETASSLCHIIEELNIPVLLTHNDSEFSIYVPTDDFNPIKEKILFGERAYFDKIVANG